jgi:hypothetical protein
MKRTFHGKDTSWEAYHSIPPGWSLDDVLAQSRALGGRLSYPANIDPSWHRSPSVDWVVYRDTLYRISDGVGDLDPACIELAVRYVLLNFYGSYSGFIRARLARRLKHAPLSDCQKRRLNEHFLSLVVSRSYSKEFKQLAALWTKVIDRPTIEQLQRYVHVRHAVYLGGSEKAWAAVSTGYGWMQKLELAVAAA